MKKPIFTEEELFYIEKVMDTNASIGEDRIRKATEQYLLAKSMDEQTVSQLLARGITELAEAQIITKSIRIKIENWRKYAESK